jgi:hypothetical protein
MDGVWTKDTFALYSCATANHSAKLMYYYPHPAFSHGVAYLITCLHSTYELSTARDKSYGENISFISREGKMQRKEDESVGQNEPRQPPTHLPVEACYDSVVSDPLLIYVTRFLYGKLSYKR